MRNILLLFILIFCFYRQGNSQNKSIEKGNLYHLKHVMLSDQDTLFSFDTIGYTYSNFYLNRIKKDDDTLQVNLIIDEYELIMFGNGIPVNDILPLKIVYYINLKTGEIYNIRYESNQISTVIEGSFRTNYFEFLVLPELESEIGFSKINFFDIENTGPSPLVGDIIYKTKYVVTEKKKNLDIVSFKSIMILKDEKETMSMDKGIHIIDESMGIDTEFTFKKNGKISVEDNYLVELKEVETIVQVMENGELVSIANRNEKNDILIIKRIDRK